MSEKHKVKPKIDPSHSDRLVDGFKDFVRAVAQMVENSNDWEATGIVLRFTRRAGQTDLSIIDDGCGATDEGLETILSCARSESRKDTSGTRKGRHGTGRLSFIPHTAEVEWETKNNPRGPLYRVTFTKATLHKMWVDGVGEWDVIRDIPRTHPIKTTGTVVTWRGLNTGDGVNPKKDRSPEALIEQLGSRLTPNVAAKVTIVKPDGSRHTLKPRDLRGEPIVGEARERYTHMKSATFQLAVVKAYDPEFDRLEIGAMGPVCLLISFLDRLKRDPRYKVISGIVTSLRNVLGNKLVVGYVDIPILNKFAVNSRDAFSDDLIDDEDLVFDIVTFLRKEVMPLVEKILGMSADELVTTDDHTLIEDLVGMFQTATGTKPAARTKLGPDPASGPTRRRVDLEVGDEIVLEVSNPKKGVRYVWDDTGAPGRVTPSEGVRVTFRSTIEDTGRVTVREFGSVDKPVVDMWVVKVVKELPLRFSEPVLHLDVCDRRRIHLENTKHVVEPLRWDVVHAGGTVTISADRRDAEFVAGEIDGEYSIVVTDGADRRAVQTIYIEAGMRSRASKRQSFQDEFEWEGHIFLIEVNRIPAGGEANRHMSYLDPGTAFSKITLIFSHPAFTGVTDAVRRALALQQMSWRVAQDRNPGKETNEVSQEGSLILAKIVSGTVKPA